MSERTLRRLGVDLHAVVPSAQPVWRATLSDAETWLGAARHARSSDARLVSLWGSDRRGALDGAFPSPADAPRAPRQAPGGEGFVVAAAYALPEGLAWIELALPAGIEAYPDLSTIFPGAARMQRATTDLLGLEAIGSEDTRPWLDHGAWTEHHPLRRDPALRAYPAAQDYPFVRVEGDGVHEIPVGPVHAGTIEPGHFRFSVVGEKVLRLEERLGYVHKGIARRFAELAPLEAHRLAGRVSGDTTVAYAWAYCMALESAWVCTPPPRALALRALMLERERVANHLGDLGALGNDGAFAFGLAQFSRLREDWQRLSRQAFGHRLMMDAVVPGGIAADLAAAHATPMLRQCDAIETELRRLRAIYDEHAGLQDRFATTGRVTPELAVQLGLCGLAARASGQRADLRCDLPWPPYDRLGVQPAVHDGGDVAARVAVRFDESFESLRLIRALLGALPSGPIHQALVQPSRAAAGAGRLG